MVSTEDIKNLAALARIEIKDEEIESVRMKMEGVLQYVSEVGQIASDEEGGAMDVPAHHNVLREDAEPEEPGIYTERILKNAPEREGNYVKVRKIL